MTEAAHSKARDILDSVRFVRTTDPYTQELIEAARSLLRILEGTDAHQAKTMITKTLPHLSGPAAFAYRAVLRELS